MTEMNKTQNEITDRSEWLAAIDRIMIASGYDPHDVNTWTTVKRQIISTLDETPR